MTKKILVDASYNDEVQVAIVENSKLEDFEYATKHRQTIKGNIYLAKVTRVEPSLQAAFIDYGGNRHGFVPFAEIHPDYYNIPVEDRKKIKEENKRQIEAATAKERLKIKEMRTSGNVADKKFEDEDGEMAFDNAMNNMIEDEINDIPALDENYFERIKQRNVDQYKVQEVIKRGQIMLVQAIKEERGNKGAAFTTYISLAGRFCVLMPNSDSIGGISRKITKIEDRKRLRTIIAQLNPGNDASVIIRTIGQGKSSEAIKKDYDYLANLWNSIRERTLSSNAPAFIYAEDDIVKKVIRDLYDDQTDEVVIEGEIAYRKAKEIASSLASDHEIKISLHKDRAPIFNKYKVSEQITSLYSPTAQMDSGAYIVINHTEALVAIDVNSGKSTSERNIEETATKTNIEAAKEVARQIKLRDLSGLIVVDFIDMIEPKNKRHVEKILRDELLKDKAKVQVGHISNFGLLEMSRQRMKPSFLEHNTIVCNHCRGRGVVRSHESCAVMIIKTIESEILGAHIDQVNVYASPETVLYVLNSKKEDLAEIEKRNHLRITFFQDNRMSADSFAIEKKKGSKQSTIVDNTVVDKQVAGITSEHHQEYTHKAEHHEHKSDDSSEIKHSRPKRKWHKNPHHRKGNKPLPKHEENK